MKPTVRTIMLLATLGALSACGNEPPPPAPPEIAAPAEVDTMMADTVAASDSVTTAEGMPLRAIMNGLSVDMAGLSQALWVEDYVQLAERADAIANHAEMMPSEIERIEAELGDEMAAFAEADEAVHQAALRMAEAAGERDLDALMEAREEVQRGCVSCHTQFRERLRTVTPARAARVR